jgi:hypothetical protein
MMKEIARLNKNYFSEGLFLAAAILFLAGGCLSPYKGEEEGSGLPETGSPVTPVSDLFDVEDPGGGGDPRVTRFYTNDTKYRTPSGYTLWSAGDGTEVSAFTSRTVTVWKPSGSAVAGYGLVICEALRTTENGTEKVFLTVMINNSGKYAVGKVYGGRYESLVWWKDSTSLIIGSGIPNKITVVKDGTQPNQYDLWLNDVFVETFNDADVPFCESKGRSGYIVVITPTDLANGSSVDVWFEE